MPAMSHAPIVRLEPRRLKKLDQLLAKLVPTFTACITTLENRIERLEGRPGISLDALRNIMSEFTRGGECSNPSTTATPSRL
jgi:hypothetical protein